jgi:hypothetical protein
MVTSEDQAKANNLLPSIFASGKATHQSGALKRRSIDPQAGHALVVLGHAIEYLTDEFILAGGSFTENRGQVDAIQLLIRLNREIYLACPEAPRISERLSALLSSPFRRVSKAGKIPAWLTHGRV